MNNGWGACKNINIVITTILAKNVFQVAYVLYW